MKIVYLIHQFFPESYTGTEKFLLNVATQMHQIGHDVKVITYSSKPDSFFTSRHRKMLLREYTYKGIPAIAIKHQSGMKLRHLNMSLEDEELTKTARFLLRKEKPDLIHVAHPMRVTEFINVANKFRIPYIITLTDFFFMCPKCTLIRDNQTPCDGPKQGENCLEFCPSFNQDFIKDRYHKAKNVLMNAKCLFAPSHFLADMFRNEFPDLHIEVVNYGVDLSKCKLNNKIYQNTDSLTFAYAGNINFHKGVHILLKSFTDLNDKDARLKVYGSGRVKKYINEINEMAENNRNIDLCGVYDESEVGDIFQNVDVLIVPSLWHENCPQVIHEALACELPVIASNVGGITELIEHRRNGFTFEMGNGEELKAILQEIINQPELLNSIKKEISKDELNTAQDEAENYVKIYNEIILERKDRTP